MQEIIKAGYTKEELRRLNRVRVSLQVLFMSDIFNSLRKQNMQRSIDGKTTTGKKITHVVAKRTADTLRYGIVEESNASNMSKQQPVTRRSWTVH